MTDSPFTDKAAPPDAAALAGALGRSIGRWEGLLADLEADHGPVTTTWKFYRNWTLQVRTRKRTVDCRFELIPTMTLRMAVGSSLWFGSGLE